MDLRTPQRRCAACSFNGSRRVGYSIAPLHAQGSCTYPHLRMADDFQAAALRHWSDAVFLYEDGRTSNADQLFGFAAECALKTALLHATGRIDEPRRQHVDVLWDRISPQSLQRRYPALSAVLTRTNPFVDWSTNQRYSDGAEPSAEALARHQQAARRVLGAVGLTGTRRPTP